jgi:hypothetical protein
VVLIAHFQDLRFGQDEDDWTSAARTTTRKKQDEDKGEKVGQCK